MAEEIGRAEVQFANHAETFDSVTILPDSTLRVANLHQQRSPFMKNMRAAAYDRHKILTLGEHDVQYFPAGSWVSVERLEENGSLISELSTRHGDSGSLRDRVVYRTIGDRLTWKEAVTAVRQELHAIGVTDRVTVDRHCEILTYRGATDFIPLTIPKYALIRRFRAMRRWSGYAKGQPGRRRGVVFSFVISPEPQAGQNFTLNTTNFPGLSIIKGSN